MPGALSTGTGDFPRADKIMGRRFELKSGNTRLAVLTVSANGEMTLQHNLTEDLLPAPCIVSPFDESGRELEIRDGGPGVAAVFVDDTGSIQLHLVADESGFVSVSDAKGLAGLRIRQMTLELGPFYKVHIYRDRVYHLYSNIEGWLKGTSLKTKRLSFDVMENVYGSYKIDCLDISRADGTTVATLEPIGASVIGGEGRVDLVGSRDRQSIMYFGAEGPHIQVAIGAAPASRRVSHPLFKGVTTAGWYWIEDVRLGRARQLDEALFKDLLRGVADLYEL